MIQMSSPNGPSVFCSEVLDSLKSVIDRSKGLKISTARPVILAAEENLHKMVVDLDKVISKVGPLFSASLSVLCS